VRITACGGPAVDAVIWWSRGLYAGVEGDQTLQPAVITIDGQIDLVDQLPAPHQDSTGADRARLSRLNDVMIVLERERATVEEALQARFADAVLTGGVESLTVSLDERAPKFSIAIHPSIEADTTLELTAGQRVVLETEATAEIVATIQKHAAYSEQPRWQPSVTALYRPPATDTAKQARVKSIWSRTLFWLLAAVILGVAYLYLKQSPV
jgi:hypothetical protein